MNKNNNTNEHNEETNNNNNELCNCSLCSNCIQYKNSNKIDSIIENSISSNEKNSHLNLINNKIDNGKKLTSKRRSKHYNDYNSDIIYNILYNNLNLNSLLKLAEDFKINYKSRKLLWMIYLDILPFNIVKQNKWLDIIKLHRQKYDNYLIKYNNNLSYFDDIKYLKSNKKMSKSDIIYREIINIINIDVERTYQEIDLFRSNKIKDSLKRILFIWSIQNPEIHYVQGMNEIAGTILYVSYSSCLNKNLINDLNEFDYNINYEIEFEPCINNESYFEHDCYTIYNTIMDRCFKSLYCYNDDKSGNIIDYETLKEKKIIEEDYNVIDKSLFLNSLEKILNEKSTALKKRINIIYKYYLKVIDEDTYNFYNKNNIEPYLFLFRWILCILSREFKLDKLILVWDNIIANEKKEEHYLLKIVNDQLSSAININMLNFKEDKLSNINNNNNNCINQENNLNTSFKDLTSSIIKGYKLKNFNFMDCIIVSMIIQIKKKLINKNDEIYIFTKLMNFINEDTDIKLLVNDALVIRDKIIERLIEESKYDFI